MSEKRKAVFIRFARVLGSTVLTALAAGIAAFAGAPDPVIATLAVVLPPLLMAADKYVRFVDASES